MTACILLSKSKEPARKLFPVPPKETLDVDMILKREYTAHSAKEANPTVQSPLMTALDFRRPLFVVGGVVRA